MNIQKPSIPKGTRDFSRGETAERNYIFDTIRSVFARFGYAAIETPAMENLSTLLGKYGDEGDKLLYRILDSGDPFASADFEKPLASQVCSKGLRYDLTVPFARYVVQHHGELTFPFKRFQMQPVWRADRPQKGRYREFYQCDVDVIGSPSQLCELELVQIIDTVFRRLGVRVEIRLNNRKLLTGLAEACGCPERVTDLTVAIDKLEKIGLDAVKAELEEKGIGGEAFSVLEKVLGLCGSPEEKMASLRELFAASEAGLKGLDELEELFGLVRAAGIATPVALDLSLARGLNYYTGAIFEVKALDWAIGSICGGGRYDNLTGIFGLPGMSGVGVSFGADRIYDVLKGLGKFPVGLGTPARLLFANMGAAEVRYILPFAAALREKGIAVEVYPDSAKLRKQFEYADRQGIPFISINGSDEAAAGTLTVKNLASGAQRSFDAAGLDSLILFLDE
ncbi:MAG: histidine--tRNA ligase [Bacteroidales bacterium]|nr:histidine--tRNA ligase [Bacteroidales bacterium]